jgi:Spy/CpxP family protein refolding chaperone
VQAHDPEAMENVRKEIDLVAEQDQKLQAISKDYQAKVQEAYAPFRDPKMPQEERQTKYKESQEKLNVLNAEVTNQVKEVLLPHQIKTLDQIDLRQKAATMLQYGPYVEKLNLSDDTKEKIKKKRDALNEAVAKMQREAFDEILQLLTPEQREQLKQPWQAQFPGQGQPPAK